MARDPVLRIYSLVIVPTVPQVQDIGVLGSSNSQGGDGGVANIGNKMRAARSEGKLPHEQMEDEYPDSEKNRVNDDDNEDLEDDSFCVFGDEEIVEVK